jgi:1,4-dihydroxy-2-naphthoate octaprenyltransferase
MIKVKVVTQSMRVPFLILTPVCVLLGMSTVVANQVEIDPFAITLALIGAFLAHISVNTLNEYYDFKSGLDLATIKTPFSGGSGALPQNPEMAGSVLMVGTLSLVVVFLIGGYFVWLYGVGIIPVGLLGLLLIATYTSWINRHPLLCLIAPGLGFGFFIVAGTQFALQGEYTAMSWLVAIVPFLLVNNLLLLNQYPDIKADTEAGRNHLPIAFGVKRSNIIYGVFALMTVLAIVSLVLFERLPMLSLIALIPMPLAFFSLYGMTRYGASIGEHQQYLGANVVVAILSPLLLAISLLLS